MAIALLVTIIPHVWLGMLEKQKFPDVWPPFSPFPGDRHFHTKYVITSSQRQESEQAVSLRLQQTSADTFGVAGFDPNYFFQGIIPCSTAIKIIYFWNHSGRDRFTGHAYILTITGY